MVTCKWLNVQMSKLLFKYLNVILMFLWLFKAVAARGIFEREGGKEEIWKCDNAKQNSLTFYRARKLILDWKFRLTVRRLSLDGCAALQRRAASVRVLRDHAEQIPVSLREVRDGQRVDVRAHAIHARPAGGQSEGGVLALHDVAGDGGVAVGEGRLPGERHRVLEDVADDQGPPRGRRRVCRR